VTILKEMKWIAALLFPAAALLAQPLGFGLKAGASLNDAVSLSSSVGSLTDLPTKFTIGPMGELRLPFGVAVEADFLYRRLNASYANGDVRASASANAWTLPILLKYRFGFPIVKPYVEAGPSFRWLTNSSFSGVSGSENTNNHGFTLGAGIEIRALIIRIAPELRYTRWGSPDFTVPNGFSVSQNQAEFLVGVSF